MGHFDLETGFWTRGEQRSLENPTISINASSEDLLAFFGVRAGNTALPHVTIETALEVPAIWCATTFLPRLLASLPIHTYKKGPDGKAERLDGDLQMLLNEAPNPEWTSVGWREYMFHQALTGGRGCTWIERQGSKAVALWPMDPDHTTVLRRGGRKYYRFEGKEYPAADVIDVPFLLRRNQVDAYSPVYKHRKTIGLMLAMNDFAGGFFAGGGVPPLALEGPMPAGIEAFKRAQADIQRAIDNSKKAGLPFFGMPPGHALKPVGINPKDGTMTESRAFQVIETSRIYLLPPVFLHDLTQGTFNNVEQQDIHLLKHCALHWTGKFEGELNLKLFGQRRRALYVEHNLDGAQRGDFKSRIEGIARAIQTGQMTPDEGRALENRPPMPGGDKLYIQGATVPIEMAGKVQIKPGANDDGKDPDAGNKQDA